MIKQYVKRYYYPAPIHINYMAKTQWTPLLISEFRCFSHTNYKHDHKMAMKSPQTNIQ